MNYFRLPLKIQMEMFPGKCQQLVKPNNKQEIDQDFVFAT